MKLLKLVTIILVLTTSLAAADDRSKTIKIKELMKIQGLYEMIEQQKTSYEEQAKQIGDTMVKQFRAQLPNIDEASVRALETSYQKFLNIAKSSWTTEEAVTVWGKYYGNSVTEIELDEILTFYKSPVGQKDITATKAAMPYWIKFFQEKDNAVLEAATQTYMSELQTLLNNALKKKS